MAAKMAAKLLLICIYRLGVKEAHLTKTILTRYLDKLQIHDGG